MKSFILITLLLISSLLIGCSNKQTTIEDRDDEQIESEYIKSIDTNKSINQSLHQCIGITKNNRQCKRLIKNGDYCWQHKPAH